MVDASNHCHVGWLYGMVLILTGLILSGCAMVPQEKVPKADLSNLKSVDRRNRKNLLVDRHVEILVAGFNQDQVNKYYGSFDDHAMRNAARRNPHVGILEIGKTQDLGTNDLSVQVDCRYTQDTTGAIFSGLTLGIIPFPCYHTWQYDFTVREGSGRAAQYHFEDGWREHIGPPMLFFVPFYDTSYDPVAERVLGNVYDQLFLSMQKDGFFDPPPKQAVPAPSGSNAVSSDRLKELESLKAAGVISEDEYRREVERLGKTGGK